MRSISRQLGRDVTKHRQLCDRGGGDGEDEIASKDAFFPLSPSSGDKKSRDVSRHMTKLSGKREIAVLYERTFA